MSFDSGYVSHITLCGVDPVCAQTFDSDTMACTGGYGLGAYDHPNTTWQLIQGGAHLEIGAGSGANGYAMIGSYWNIVCDPAQLFPVTAPIIGTRGDASLIVQGWELRTSLACRERNQTLIDLAQHLLANRPNITLQSSTGSAASSPPPPPSSLSSAISALSSSSPPLHKTTPPHATARHYPLARLGTSLTLHSIPAATSSPSQACSTLEHSQRAAAACSSCRWWTSTRTGQ